MQEDPDRSTTDQAPTAELLARLVETQTLLAAERASNQSLCDELLRVRSEKNAGAVAAAGGIERDNNNSSVSATATTEDTEPPAERVRRHNRGNDERPRRPWQNVLYKRQPYADNHVPDSFLEKLVTNGELAQTVSVNSTAAGSQQQSAAVRGATGAGCVWTCAKLGRRIGRLRRLLVIKHLG